MRNEGPETLGRSRRWRWALVGPVLLLLFGTSAGVGLHLGILHYFLMRWRGPVALLAPVVFVTSSLVFATVTWGLWRWVFPRLPSEGGGPLNLDLEWRGAIGEKSFDVDFE